ncbi:MAG TPA: NrfD/PsrC family molybdoenzyme membrane anchor subunit [Calidithermus sp.]|nr:NrfD/PsrC family molybdoenzyme membrane anchor subunit [Calidithermus sp.]
MPLLQSSHWPFLIDVYFFLGGLAGGAFVLATIAHLANPRRYADVVRVGYYLALAALIPCPIILIVDLGVPSRFLNMILNFNVLSPMSMGAWALLAFSACAGLAALLQFLEDTGKRRDLGGPKLVVGVVGAFFGFFLAAYPGVLLGATARPLWIHGHALGALFLAVGASTGAAAIALIVAALRSGARDVLGRVSTALVVALVVQLVSLIVFVVSVQASGSPASLQALGLVLSGPYSLLFWLGAVLVGSIVPLLIGLVVMKRQSVGLAALASVLVLVGGFLVKTVIMAAGQA